MARAFKARAGKDYPAHGIKKGDTYYHWSFFRGPKQFSKTYPRQSQLTNAPALSEAYACQEGLEDALAAATCPDDIVTALDDAISAAEDCVGTFDESIENLEQAFPNGCPALEEKQEQKDGLEAWKDSLESTKSEVESKSASDYQEDVESFEDLSPEKQQEWMDEVRELAGQDSLDI